MQASSWPGEEQCFLPMQEPAVRSWERKHPGSANSLHEYTLFCLQSAELCRLSQVGLLSYSRKCYRGYKHGRVWKIKGFFAMQRFAH